MSLATLRARIPAINSWLLAGVFFCIPIQVAPAFWLTAAILLLWLVEGRYADKLRTALAEPLTWIFAAYYGVFLLSMLWTEDKAWGWRMVGKQQFFLLFPLYFTVARREHLGRYVGAFLLSVSMCELLAFYNWAQLHLWPGLPDGIRVDKGADDTAPFVDRILYTPSLALAGYLAGHRLLFEAQSLRSRAMYALLLLSTTVNLLISGGRAGMVGFLALLALLVFQRFARRPVLAAATASLLIAAVVLGGYHGNSYFKARVDEAIDQVSHYEERPNSSVGLRIVYSTNAWRIYAEHPLLGVGAGDYPEEYRKMNALHTPRWKPAWNPHSQYLLALTSAGLAGGAALLAVLLVPLLRDRPAGDRRRIGRALPVLFIVLCLFESYLMRSNTSLMYVLFLAALWRGTGDANA